MSLNTVINAKLRKLWIELLNENFFHSVSESELGDDEKIHQLWPIQYPEFQNNCTLFIGLNPSFPKKAESQPLALNSVDELKNELIQKQIVENELESMGGKNRDLETAYSYFQRFIELHKLMTHDLDEYPNEWNHIDIFAVRERSQKRFGNAFNMESPKKGQSDEAQVMDFGVGYDFDWPNGEKGEWLKRQFNIFEEAVYKLKPTLLLVANALASKLLIANWKDTKSEFELSDFRKDDGHYYLGHDKWSEERPIFFSGMISGQRALDVHSRLRLAWHMREIMKKIRD